MRDKLYQDAKLFTATLETATLSKIQREFKIGFNRALQYLEYMVEDKLIAAPNDYGIYKVIKE